MRVWCEVYDASDVLQGVVYTVMQASVTRALDGAGTINLNVPLTDSDALTLLTNERRVRIYVEQDEKTRELGRGVVRSRTLDEDSSRATMSISGPDSLDALIRRNTLLGRIYNFQTVAAIASDLVELVPGWSATADSGALTISQNARFDGASVLKALLRLAEEAGLHIREGETANTIEIGAFGTSNNIRLAKLHSLTREIYHDDNLILIQSIQVKEDSKGVVNWIIPTGAGEGTATLDLARNEYTSPYTVGTLTGPDGRTLYYLADQTSIDEYGQVERLITFKEIAPIANNDLAKARAANALYLAAVAWLQRNKDPLTTYSVRGVKCRTVIRPGDKVWLEYKGVAETSEGLLTYIDVNQEVWVMRVTESVGVGGMTLTLELATVDRQQKDTAAIVVDMMEAIRARNVSVQTFPAVFTYSAWDTVQWGGASYWQKRAQFSLAVDSKITDVVSVTMQFKTRPLSVTGTFDAFTGAPPHDTEFGSYVFQVRESTHYPRGIRLFIDDVEVTDDLGGPWAATDAAVDVTLDITDIIVNASGGLYQKHTVAFECEEELDLDMIQIVIGASQEVNSSHGFIECSFQVMGTVQAIVPT